MITRYGQTVFRIKKRNIDAFLAHEERSFERRLVSRLRDNFEGLRDKTDEELTTFVRLGRERAATHGIGSPYGVSLYVGIMAELGVDFDRGGRYPWVDELLAAEELTGNVKAELICDRAVAFRRSGGN
jgi:hypothetical protein